MTFGNYVLFNLLVAILVEGFQAEVTPCPAHLALPRAVLLPGGMVACLEPPPPSAVDCKVLGGLAGCTPD